MNESLADRLEQAMVNFNAPENSDDQALTFAEELFETELVSLILAALRATEWGWTESPPSEPGFYWYRSDTAEPRPVQVCHLGGFTMLGLHVKGYASGKITPLDEWICCEWSTRCIDPPTKV